MSENLVHILSNIGRPNIMLVGDFMLDKYVWGEVNRISQEAPIPVLNVASEEIRPGGAGSVASNLAHLGANIFCYGTIGNDNEGRLLLDNLNDLGVDTEGIVQDSDRPTTVKVRMMGHLQSAGKGIQQLLRIDYEKTDDIEEEKQEVIINKIEDKIQQVDIVLISDMNKGLLSRRILDAVIKSGKDHNVPVIVDPGLTKDYGIYRGATAITPNRFETKLSTGIKITDVNSMKSAGKKLLEENLFEYIIITADKDGMFLYSRDREMTN